MPPSIDWLDETAINQSYQGLPITTHCVVMDSLPSTNQWVAEHANHPTPLLVCACEQQTQGKGRSGKHWHSRMAEDLTVSLRWEPPKQRSKETPTLSLVTAIILARWVESLTPTQECQIKWPNDVLVNHRKLAGILLEQINTRQVIIGIGLNVAPIDDKQLSHIQQPAIALRALNNALPNRTALLSSLIGAMNHGLYEFHEHGFEPFHQCWKKRDTLLDQCVVHTLGDRQKTGVARGISKSGELILERNGTEETLCSGTIRLLSTGELPDDRNQ